MLLPAGLLHNTKLNRWHPIIFRPGPAPSSDPSEPIQRYKSQGHHTDGFATRDEALDYFESEEVKNAGVKFMNVEWDWPGEGIPAMVEWFSMDTHIGFTIPAPKVEAPAHKTETSVATT